MIGFQVGVRTGEIYSACVCFLTGEKESGNAQNSCQYRACVV